MSGSWKVVPLVAAVLLGGCARIAETHYFEQPLADGSGRSNYFRIRVTGHSWFSSTRYIAGYYDERAIDLFFNEVKTGSPPSDGAGAEGKAASPRATFRPLFPQDAKLPGTDELVKPLKDAGDGTFLMLFSTNATAVADAIGQFAENQLAADALVNIVSRGEVRDLDARKERADRGLAGVSALKAELDALVGLLPDGPAAPPQDETNRAMLRVLNAVARGLGHTGSFTTTDQAAGWFATVQP
jgi:hypothetical protein